MEHFIEDFDAKVASGAQGAHGQVFDTNWDFQNEQLEERYNEFRLKRDRELSVIRLEKKPVSTAIN